MRGHSWYNTKLLLSLLCLTGLGSNRLSGQSDYRIDKFNAQNGLQEDHWVRSVQVDSSGLIWLSLNKGGLACFDGQHFINYPLPKEWEATGRRSEVFRHRIDGHNKFWIQYFDAIGFFDPQTGVYTLPETLGDIPNKGLVGMQCTRSGSISFRSIEYLYIARPGKNPEVVGISPDVDHTGIGVYGVSEDSKGAFWLVTNIGYFHYARGSETPEFLGFNHTPDNPIPPIDRADTKTVMLPSGYLWDVYGDQLRKIDPAGKIVESYRSQEYKYLYDVLETGDIRWFATFDGLTKLTYRKHRFKSWLDVPYDLMSGPVTGISCYGILEGEDGRMIITTAVPDTIFEIFPDQPGKAKAIPMPGVHMYGSGTDRQGRIWITSNGDPGYFDRSMAAYTRYRRDKLGPHILSYLQLSNGEIWFAGAEGIYKMDFEQEKRVLITPENKYFVWQLHQTSDGDLWAATRDGILRLREQNGAWEIIRQYNKSNTPGLKAEEIKSIHEQGDFLWCGSTNGLVRLNKTTGEAFTITKQLGLPDDLVYCAIPAEGYLWAPTNNGLARITLSSVIAGAPEHPEIAIFNIDDGLPHFEFNSQAFFQRKDGKIWLGTLNGVICFDPKEMAKSNPSGDKPVVLVEFSRYDSHEGAPVSVNMLNPDPANPLILRPRDLYFTASFALLDYQNPKLNQYSYKLEGFDPDWNYAGNQNTLRYTNLPAGNYTLRIRGANPNGAWSAKESATEIRVLQVWYKTWWAWAIYVLSASGLFWLVYKVRLRQVRLAYALDMEHQRSENLKSQEAFKNRFFTNITHEFRTPLTVILGIADQLSAHRQAHSAEPRQNQLKLIKRNGENLLRLINEILDLAKLESNSLKMEYIQADILPYLRYIAESLHSLANAQNILLRVESSESGIVMDYDPDRILQVVHNLLSNAIKFTPSGGKVTLTADLVRDKDRPWLKLRVSDTGVGIPEAELPHIFERFFQASNQGNARTSGAGIGLELTRELVRAMSGEIAAESRAGAGTVFTVTLPVRNEAEPGGMRGWEDAGLTSATPQLHQSTTPQPHNSPHLLLIEDNPDVVEYLAACLDGQYNLDFAYNGRAGIEKALESIPDLVISDVMMPEKDGFEVCDTLKNDERTSHIPIVLLTAKADVESRLAGLRRGADAYLAKPFHQEELEIILQNLFEIRKKLQAKFGDLSRNAAETAPKPTAAAPDPEDLFLQKLRSKIESRLSDAGLSVDDICLMMGMSHSGIHRKVTALTGRSLVLYVRAVRLNKARQLLSERQMTISEVAYETGFNDPKFFSRVFSEEFGIPPSQFKQNYN